MVSHGQPWGVNKREEVLLQRGGGNWGRCCYHRGVLPVGLADRHAAQTSSDRCSWFLPWLSIFTFPPLEQNLSLKVSLTNSQVFQVQQPSCHLCRDGLLLGIMSDMGGKVYGLNTAFVQVSQATGAKLNSKKIQSKIKNENRSSDLKAVNAGVISILDISSLDDRSNNWRGFSFSQ